MCYIKFYSSKSVGILIKIRHGSFENVSAMAASDELGLEEMEPLNVMGFSFSLSRLI